jgi:hypothetical protein
MVTIRKVFFVWQMDAEKRWLEEQARNGLVLADSGLFKYIFKEEEPQDLIYEFDFQMMGKADEPEYLEIMQDWTLATRFGGWYYFYRVNDGVSHELFNDNDSRKSLFRRLLGFLLITGFPLYYQLLIMFPNMEASKLTFPSFYFFFRIVVVIFSIIHFSVLIKLFFIHKRFSSSLRE